MTMYYSKGELEYVEFQRQAKMREMAYRGEVDLVQTADGTVRAVKDGQYWEPDMSYLHREQS